ncbi:alkaline phosphatase D family protein [Pleionea litopenaei]|uniref:Alkaline phosphatase D family protein n=1 Tax=Pleionea litopenaei TaxID=3070815 RepID=A0AA51RW91_9GAMM|nr:alkaline phosphatase D family protein [Pleionea sp. HL-JVS1]WMS88619.1 alkaline phosphatase D family protein [Pleionea sp. HL-JVS1]
MTKLTRRDFIRATSLGMGTTIVASGLTGCVIDDDSDRHTAVDFLHGVASGDPTSASVIVWTRITVEDDSEVTVGWEVYNDETDQFVISGFTQVNASTDHTLKLDLISLSPGTRYRYFFTSNGKRSPIGYTKTLPVGHIESAKFGVVSCSNYPAGLFHVYGEVAKRNDLDAVLHLGDYIYEYGDGGYATERANEIGRGFNSDNNTELLGVADYRKRYAQYRTDPNLQKCHRKFPFIAVWDDHEVANDAYKDGAENHNDGEGDFETRKVEALMAYFEWMPVRDKFAQGDLAIYRTFRYGDLLDLHMLDTRIIGRDQPIDIYDFVDGSGNIDAVAFEAALSDTSRTLLGGQQLAWLQSAMATSTAKWQVLGQQVLMGKMFLPAAIATQALSIDQFVLIARVAQIAAIYERYQANDPTLTPEELAILTPENLALLQANQALLTPENIALIQLPSIPYNLDAWDGYAYEREVVLGTAQAFDKNLVVLAGDTHNAWASDLKTFTGAQVGVEFATASVSSPGLEVYLQIPNRETAIEYEAGITQLVDNLAFCNVYDRGFLTVTFTHDEATADWTFIDDVFSESYQVMSSRQKSMSVLPGAGNRQLID